MGDVIDLNRERLKLLAKRDVALERAHEATKVVCHAFDAVERATKALEDLDERIRARLVEICSPGPSPTPIDPALHNLTSGRGDA